MQQLIVILIDLVAIAALAYGIYFRRHGRRDMLFAYVGLNVGVLGATMALDTATIGAGLGLGLFGVLSIIRLRSSELTQAEVAYYFVSLAMGLLGGLVLDPPWAGSALILLLLVVVYVADHPRLLRRYRQQLVTLDAAYTDERELTFRLETLLGAEVKQLCIDSIDLVRDMTVVDVRYRLLERSEAQKRRHEQEHLELTALLDREDASWP